MISTLSKSALRQPSSAPKTVALSVVVPTFNESGNIEAIVTALCAVLDARLPDDYELIVVDDDSPDRTWETAIALSSRYPRLSVIRREGERGLAAAVIHGLRSCQGAIVGTINADLQHPPEAIVDLFDAIESGADVANASRYIGAGSIAGWSLSRRILSKGAGALAWLLLPGTARHLSDPMSGCYLVRKYVLDSCLDDIRPRGFKTLIEILVRAGKVKVVEVGYTFRERQVGCSKVTWKSYFQFVFQLIALRFHRHSHR
ncbi:MAG TPA: polyprenol monophosphomannose synthase [Trichormus sp.]